LALIERVVARETVDSEPELVSHKGDATSAMERHFVLFPVRQVIIEPRHPGNQTTVVRTLWLPGKSRDSDAQTMSALPLRFTHKWAQLSRLRIILCHFVSPHQSAIRLHSIF